MPTQEVQRLLDHGVQIPAPECVVIDADIDPERIAPSAQLFPGTRLQGADTSLGPDCVLGEEAPVTLENCQLGAGVKLKGGFFSQSVFMDGVTFASCAHVRPGCLLEEGASCGHSVGLKQTVLMPFVALGSLINFCDCLMAGGTGPRNHSEVGSSFIHFNFSAHQDKATPSLFGDVPRGVMLDQAPIFLGGQGGIVGPSLIAYGTITAAGTVYRRDVSEPGQLVFGQFTRPAGKSSYNPALYGDIRRIVRNNLVYIANIIALNQWYLHVRAPKAQGVPHVTACLDGATHVLQRILEERLARMKQLCEKLRTSLDIAGRQFGSNLPDQPYAGQAACVDQWQGCAANILALDPATCATGDRDHFLAEWSSIKGHDMIESIQALSHEARESGSRWLQAIVDRTTSLGPHLG